MFKQQSGFTLIELVVVIVILGILAATALPRFITITTDARIAKMNGAAAALSSAGSLAHAAQLVLQVASGAAISMEGVNVTMVNGYPTGDAGGIGNASNLAGSADFVTSAAGGVYTVTPDAGHAPCAVTYTAAVAPSPPSVSKAAVTGATGQTNCS